MMNLKEFSKFSMILSMSYASSLFARAFNDEQDLKHFFNQIHGEYRIVSIDTSCTSYLNSMKSRAGIRGLDIYTLHLPQRITIPSVNSDKEGNTVELPSFEISVTKTVIHDIRDENLRKVGEEKPFEATVRSHSILLNSNFEKRNATDPNKFEKSTWAISSDRKTLRQINSHRVDIGGLFSNYSTRKYHVTFKNLGGGRVSIEDKNGICVFGLKK